jgi:hypothetical protein
MCARARSGSLYRHFEPRRPGTPSGVIDTQLMGFPSLSQPLMQVAWRLGRYMATHSEDVNQDDIVVVPARSQQLMGT